MRKPGAILALAIAFASCKTTQPAATNRYRADSVRVERKDSIVYREKLRRDTVRLKGDSIRIVVPVPCDTLNPVLGKAKSGRVNLKYAITNGQLEIDCNADSLLVEIWKRDVELYDLRQSQAATASHASQTQTVIQVQKQYRTPFWNWVLIAVLLAWIFRRQLLKGVKMLAKIPMPWK